MKRRWICVFNPQQQLTVADIVNGFKESQLANIIYKYGEEPRSRRIAAAIVNRRPVATTLELTGIIEKAVGGRKSRIHPATRTFQALRIAVNHELENLETALRQAINMLGYGGRLVVISYHSLEDRIVKQVLQEESSGCICPPEIPVCICNHKPRIQLVNRKVITPSAEEIRLNPRSRSARMRVAERVMQTAEKNLHSAGLFLIGLTGCLAGSASLFSLN
jgi:16S rRNA (cytosine1402-N4)-methyltransferase